MSNSLVGQVRCLLDRLVSSRNMVNDDRETILDEISLEASGLPRERVVEALDQAIGLSKRRRREAVLILSQLTDVPKAVERIGEWLKDSEAEVRASLIQTVGHRRLVQFAPLLNEIMKTDPDVFCRQRAIHVAGSLKRPENLKTLLQLAEQNDPVLVWDLACALKEYATEECRRPLLRWFDGGTQNKSTRMVSAWGLGKLGDPKAISHLVQALDEINQRGVDSMPGAYPIRVAQALCDIYGWPFEWNIDAITTTVRLAKEAGLTSLHSTPR